MTERISSGTDHLDAVLGGGLPRAGISLIIGLPGSGKTILAQQYAFINGRPDRPALYLSTVSEPLEKILRYGQTLTIFDPAAVGSSVYYDDLGSTLHEGGLSGVLDRVRVLIRERRPSVVVIDSFKALHAYAADSADFRRFLHNLAGMYSAYPVTALWVGEYGPDEAAVAPEFAVADAIVALGSVGTAERTSRLLQVLKLRGGDFLPGKHAYRLSAGGVTVFPRLADPRNPAGYDLRPTRVQSGIRALDEMLENGFWPGSSTLLAGPTGVGKTVMGLHFVLHGAHRGERGVIATMQENPVQLERTAQQFTWSLDDDEVTVMYRSPVDLHLDEWVYELFGAIEATGATRVLIDSLGDLQAASPDIPRFREYLYSLVQRCSRGGVTLLMTYEVPELLGLTRLSEGGVSHMADNVVLLQYRTHEQAVSRTLTVLKSRAARHDPRILEFEISSNGIALTPQSP
ncbi:ATPase domain-containing protein [Pseudonocardia sp. H11422]|uniref:ATPase domain-containing protein n=1 Tax=Pseudonocardia sp. H11422 TaxID=2835866 RepID=UPI001BDCFD78|nr:ATPase domain-containing protein [Pseudonocardia sp. H11422]